MKSFVECDIGQETVAEIQASVRRRIAGKYLQDFYCGLLQLALEDPERSFTRAQIAAVYDPERTEVTDAHWAKEGKIFGQLETHRSYPSQGMNGRLLAIDRDNSERPYRYRIGALDPQDTCVPFLLEGSILRYRESDTPPRLSVIGRLTHPGVGESREQYRKWLFVMPLLTMCALVVAALLLMTLTAFVSIGTRHLPWDTYGILAAIAAALWWSVSRRWERLFDDRTLLLGLGDIAGADRGVVLDCEYAAGRRSIVLRRYVSECPICNESTVSLAPGEPEFIRRLVGRCENSPREHVFSFDRVTLEGAPLRLKPSNTLI